MVLGVQSRAGLAQLDATCAGAHALMDTARAERALLGALLQSGWGVAPSDVTWSAARNETEASLLWAVGATPNGLDPGRTGAVSGEVASVTLQPMARRRVPFEGASRRHLRVKVLRVHPLHPSA